MKIPPEEAPNVRVLFFFCTGRMEDAVRRILFYLSFNLEKGEVPREFIISLFATLLSRI